MFTVFGCRNTRSLRVTWALEEAGADYRYVKVDLMNGDGRRPPFADVNPAGKVPALVDGDLVLTESAAIVSYVGDRFPASGLTPACGTRLRALYDKWCFYVLSELEQPLWTIAKHTFAIPRQYRVPQIIDTAKWEFDVALKAMDRQFGDGEYLLGPQFSGADILAAHTLAWAMARDLPLDSPRLVDYANRCLARSARLRAETREAQA